MAPATGQWQVEIPVDVVTWQAGIDMLTNELGGAPSLLQIRHVSIASELAGGDDDVYTFDELWSGPVSVRIVGGTVDADGGTFVPQQGLISAITRGLEIDITTWSTLPANARVVVTGPVADEVDEAVALSYSLQLLGRR